MKQVLCAVLSIAGFVGYVSAQNGGKKIDTSAELQKAINSSAAEDLEKLKVDMAKLDALSEEISSRTDAHFKAGKIDRKAIEEEFKSLVKEPDAPKRNSRIDDFRARYEQRVRQSMIAAGVDSKKEQARIGSVFPRGYDPATDVTIDSSNLQIIRRPPPQELEAHLPDTTVQNTIENRFRPPYATAGTAGTDILLAQAFANPVEGELRVDTTTVYIGTTQTRAFIVHKIPVPTGTRALSVSAEFDEIQFAARADTIFGSASADAIVNIRVLRGDRVIARNRRSLARGCDQLGLRRAERARAVDDRMSDRPRSSRRRRPPDGGHRV